MLPPMAQESSAAIIRWVPMIGRDRGESADGEAERDGMGRGAQAGADDRRRSGPSGSNCGGATYERASAPTNSPLATPEQHQYLLGRASALAKRRAGR